MELNTPSTPEHPIETNVPLNSSVTKNSPKKNIYIILVILLLLLLIIIAIAKFSTMETHKHLISNNLPNQTKYSPTTAMNAPTLVSSSTNKGMSTTVAPSSNDQIPTSTAKSYLVIKQWNVEFQTNVGMKFIYTYVPAAADNLSGLAYAQFNTSALSSYCANNANDNAGSLGRSVHDPEWFQTESSQGGPAYTLINKLGSYYYYYFGPQDSCPYKPNNDPQTNAMSSLSADLKTLQPVQ